jgi:hypothetical protein
MSITIFSAFRSTVTNFTERVIRSTDKWLVDPVTGAPVGVQNPNANGPDARFVPVDLTAAQIASPTAAMLADIDATYRLNTPPYTRYFSDGSELVPMGTAGGGGGEIIVPPGFSVTYNAPLTISGTQMLVVQGTAKVQ